MGPKLIRRAERIAWIACLATLAIWAATYLTWPFSNDQGNLAWVGDVVLSGGMPYRDAWDVKGPAAHLLFALTQRAFGRNEWGVRLFDLGMLAGSAYALYRIVKAYAGAMSPRWAVVLYLLWYASLNHHATAQPDAWAAALLSMTVALLLTRAHLSLVSAAGAGVLVAICALIKPTYALFLALPALQGLPYIRSDGFRRVGWFWLTCAVGFVAPIGLCIVWFVSRGALDDWIAVHLHWIPSSYTQIDAAWLNRFQYLLAFLTTEQFAPAVPLVAGGLYVVRRWSPADALVLAAWGCIAVFGVLIQGQFYAYHWHPLYPPLAALAGLGFAALGKWLTDQPEVLPLIVEAPRRRQPEIPITRPVGVALTAVVLAGAMAQPVVHVFRFAKSAVIGDFSGYDRVEFGPFGHHGGVFPELVDYLGARSSPSDAVLVWGSAAGVNYLTRRGALSPFGFVQPLVDPPETELRRRYREQFMSRLMSAPPRYVVALNAATCSRNPSPGERQLLGRAEGIMRCLNDIPAVSAFVSERYGMETSIGPLDVWRLR